MKLTKRLTSMALAAIMTLSVTVSISAEELPLPTSATTATTLVASNSISVELDGNEVVMMDAKPILVNGTVFLPFSAFYKAIGAETSYESSTKTATAIKNDVVAIFTVNSERIQSKKNGEITTHYAKNAAPFIQNDLTYIPAEWAGKALGYNTGYDPSTNTVFMIDAVKMMKPYSTSFKIMDKYMAYSSKYMENTYQISGDYAMALRLGRKKDANPIKVTGDMSGYTNGIKADMDMTMKVDMKDALKELTGVDPSTDKEMQEMIKMMEQIDMGIYLNMETGKYYFRSPMITSSLNLNENVWIEMDLNEYFSAMGIDPSFLEQMINLSKKSSFTEYLTEMFTLMPISSKQDIDALNQMLNMMVIMYGDDAFTKSPGSYVSNYQTTQNGTKMGIKLELITNSGDQVIGYNMEMNVNADKTDVMKITASQDKNNTVKMNMEMDVPGYLNFIFDINMKMKESKSKVFGMPSSNNEIISFENALSQ